MAFIRLARFPGGTEEQYHAVVDELGTDHAQAQGRILVAAGPVEDSWQIVNVWETREDLDAFSRDALGPAFARAGVRGFTTPPEITDLETTDLHVGATLAR